MTPLVYIDRISGQKEVERVYGDKFLNFLYGDDFLSRLFGAPLLHLLSRFAFFSSFVGFWQKQPFTKKKIIPFIKNYNIDASEFTKPVTDFCSFNDFFIRKLKKTARPIDQRADCAIIPADGRYWFYPKISNAQYFHIKSEKFNLGALLEDPALAEEYRDGSMVVARLCPSDYHRFHFPIDCSPGQTKLINGWLYSVNPLALKKDFDIFSKNKRTLCFLDSAEFGKVAYLEVGATSVGTIHETYQPGKLYSKGAEKGYFSFGGSTLVLLFKAGRIIFDKDLLHATQSGLEIRCLFGQSMGFSNFS